MAVVSDSVLFAIDARVSFVACMDTSLNRAGGFAGAYKARLRMCQLETGNLYS